MGSALMGALRISSFLTEGLLGTPVNLLLSSQKCQAQDVRSKRRDPNPKDNSSIRKEASTYKGFHSTFAASFSYEGVFVRVRVPLFAARRTSSASRSRAPSPLRSERNRRPWLYREHDSVPRRMLPPMEEEPPTPTPEIY